MKDTAQFIRDTFTEFYRAKDHRVVKSAPLVPKDDPTLLFTSAGMVQFKKLYSGDVPLEYSRALSIQKCLRATDLEQVGHTPRHLTFFEMLGHFSFGDYFKREAIVWNWDLFTRVFRLPVERLKVSVYVEDDEAYDIWHREVGLAHDKIFRLGKEDNFWGPAGETGACGPSTEVYYDLGADLGCPKPTCGPGCDCLRWIEVGNFVFPQFDMQKDGSMPPLKNRGIDTGIGLDRLCLVLEGKRSLFETTLFTPIITRLEEMTGRAYQDPYKSSFHIIADHIRTLTFTLSEGVLPSNEGRGYVLRRILRRAAVQGHRLGLDRPFLFELCDEVVRLMRDAYLELGEALPAVRVALRAEEDRFQTTLSHGLQRFDEAEARLRADGGDTLSGEVVFQLYDTYGFPNDLTSVLAEERGLSVDQGGFERVMAEQRGRSRGAAKFYQAAGESLAWTVLSEGEHSVFRGYDLLRLSARIRRYAPVPAGEREYWVLLDETPFYAESGGQVGDRGLLLADGFRARVLDTQKREGEVRHRVALEEGAFSDLGVDTELEAAVDPVLRADTMRNHTGTHLLHAALRAVLGPHVTQAGSLVAPDRLRFDFTHLKPLTPEELSAIEEVVNEQILEDRPVSTRESGYEDAIKEGVTALFGEKYGDRVRRIEVGDFSRELCGGTHCRSTGQIGVLLILSEAGIAAGTRRIEAITGRGAIQETRRSRLQVEQVRQIFQSTVDELPQKARSLRDELHKLRKAVKDRKQQGSGGGDADLGARLERAPGGAWLAGEIELDEGTDLRAYGDQLRGQIESGAGLLLVKSAGKLTLLAVVTDDLVANGTLRADEIVRSAAEAAGGRGGGKPHLAMAGVGDASRAGLALEAGRSHILSALGA